MDQKASYAIGTRIGMNLKRDAVQLDVDQFVAGLTDGFEGKELAMTEEQMQEVMMALQQKVQAAQQAEMAEAGAANIEAAKKFLEDNGKVEGVVTTDSGLQYQVITTGDGPKPTKEDTIEAHYHGTLIDGTVFDSSVQRGQPAKFPVGGVIPGWTEALQLMPVGSKWKLFIPSELAYGDRGAGDRIGPNSALVFEVELLSIEGK